MITKKSNYSIAKMRNKVKQLRLERGLSQEKLAEMTGYHSTTIKRVERHKTISIQYRLLGALSKALNCPIDDLFDREDMVLEDA